MRLETISRGKRKIDSIDCEVNGSARQTLSQTMPVIAAVLALMGTSSAFTPSPNAKMPSSSLSMVPRFDKKTNRWFTDDPEEMAGSSYGPIGSLYRAGPKPFLQRITDPDIYDQAVLKYMAQDKCDRKEAQGNMDAYLDNPQDWAYQKTSERNGAYKKDYDNANMQPKQIALTTVWGESFFWGGRCCLFLFLITIICSL